jgi:hypothetical protein
VTLVEPGKTYKINVKSSRADGPGDPVMDEA